MIEYPKKYFPEIEPYNKFYFKVSNLHELYVEECGNPKGKPVVFLHGGPGAGISPNHRRFFDPAKYRIVLFDQRGCGKSKPFASIEENTTDEVIQDIEKLRTHLKISKWQVFGGSWGCYLGLLYAQAYPQNVTELIVRGTFTATQKEIDWLYKFGASEIFYREWLDFVEWIPANERNDLIKAYHQRLNHKDQKVCMDAAKKWNDWETSILSLYKDPRNFEIGENTLPIARIECYYALNQYFNDNDRVFRQIDRMKEIPGVIVHGQYDMICPTRNAYDLHKAWGKADVKIVPDAGHASSEPGIVHELISATNRFSF